ncbi:ABC transporter permease [Prescottella equi]|uniref:ABC transporter permease n=1 Tax=Rhodococcus hoagii TaxID=43767 RepID=UPI001F5BC1FE|nr:ABC transporter permease [Prescottella equi]UNQ34989.1 ABC transporter permease [Prescottella equi]
MIWVTWWQFRTTILAAVGGILTLAAIALICGTIVRQRTGQRSAVTADYVDESTFEWLVAASLVSIGVLAALLPVALGVLVGVTVFSRDIERGTHVLGLSQSVSRARWYGSRLLVVFVPVSIAMAVLGAALEWTRTADALWHYGYLSRATWSGHSSLTFPLFQSGALTAATYTALALVLGSLAALLLRNTLGSMVVTLVAVSAFMLGFQFGARPHYASPVVEARPLDAQYRVAYTSDQGSVWQLSEGYVDAQGRRVEFDYRKCNQIGENLEWSQRPDETLADYEAREATMIATQDREFEACQRAQGLDHYEVRYHPDSLFRRFQVTEASLALGLSLLLIIPSMWAVRRLRP